MRRLPLPPTRLVADEALSRSRNNTFSGSTFNNPTIVGGTALNTVLTTVSLINPTVEGTCRYELFPVPGAPPTTETDTNQFVIQTTDATANVVLASILIPDLTDFRLDVEVKAKQVGAAVGGEWKLSMSWVRNGGAPQPELAAVFSDARGTNGPGAPPAGWSATLLLSGNNAQIVVTGAVATTIDWGALAQWSITQ